MATASTSSLELTAITDDARLKYWFEIKPKPPKPKAKSNPAGNKADTSSAQGGDDEYEDDEELEGINMIFYSDILPIKWYSLNPRKFETVPSETEMKFSIASGFDYLCYSYTKINIPPLWVKDEYAGRYRFAWCYDLGYRIMPEATFIVDDVELDYLNVDAIIAYNEHFVDTNESYQRDVGNIPELVDWSSEHAGTTIQPPQPWFYGRRSETAFPLFRMNSVATCHHKYQLDNHISHLLRMQEMVNGTWVDIHVDISVLSGYSNEGKIPQPELWGTFGKIDDKELAYNQCERPVETAYIENIVSIVSGNPKIYGAKDDIPLAYTAPVKAMLWMAQNRSAAIYNNHGNYSSDSDNLMRGKCPIYLNTLRYGSKTPKFREMESLHFQGPLTRPHFPFQPKRPGLLGFAFCQMPSAIGIDVGVLLDKLAAHLEVTFRNPDNISTTSQLPSYRNQVARASPEFVLMCHLLTLREINIHWKRTPCVEIMV